MKRIFIALAVLSAFLLLVACGGEEETTPTAAPTVAPVTTLAATKAAGSDLLTATPGGQPAAVCADATPPSYIKELVLATDTEKDTFKPIAVTEEYEPTQEVFHAVVMLDNSPADTKLKSVWYLLDAKGYTPNTKIDENEVSTGSGGTRNVDFTLKGTQERWPPGTYCVEVYANGTLALTKQFHVVGDTTPSNAGAEVIKQVVLAGDSKAGTFEPVNPTATFKKDAPFIHATVQIENAPPNTVFRARWYPPSQDPLDFELTTDGTRWMDFRLTPAPDGFPTGEYKVEIYVNDQLAQTQSFTVE